MSVERYISSIRNPVKKQYAKAYLEFINGNTRQPSYTGLSYTAAQCVRMRLNDLTDGCRPVTTH